MKKLKTKNYRLETRHAFTLLELLIASTIFAIVMMMALGAITDSANYLAKLKAMRVSSEESRRIADILGEDIKKANTELSVTYDDGTSYPNTLYKSGIALFSCDSATAKCTPQHSELASISTSDSLASEFKANTLVLAEKDNSGNLVYKVYYNFVDSVSNDKMLYYNEVTGQTNLDLINSDNIKKDGNEISGGNVTELDLMNDVVINFGGYAPDSATMEIPANRQQAYVFYNINVKTRGALKQQELFDINVLSGTTSRNYN